MDARQFTSFEHILLGLICTAPSSGYDLKRIFAVTPMGLYQPSSGALYPALRRLEVRGMVQAQADSSPAGQSSRHRRVYEATQAGLAVHTSWLHTPVEAATVARDLGLHLMRFVMMEHRLQPEEVLTFLRSLADSLAAFTAGLEKYAGLEQHTGGTDIHDRHPRLALDHGLAVHRASRQWAEHAIEALSAVAVLPDHGVS